MSNLKTTSNWQRFNEYFLRVDSLGVTLDISRMGFADDFFDAMAKPAGKAFEAMNELEKGAIANPDEGRMVGHYWLRAPQLAPTEEIRKQIEGMRARLGEFVADVHAGRIAASSGRRFERVLVVGIGGSALGPQLVADALGTAADKMAVDFFDNTDPDGFQRVLGRIGSGLSSTLIVVISKSGGTKETRNGMLVVQAACRAAGLDFTRQAVAVTGEGSELDKVAATEGWLARFPMWDWVGGRTSVMSAVGLLPAALQGVDIEAFLSGAAWMDVATREGNHRRNPAMVLALMWHHAGGGRGLKDMVILPYKDRLVLFSKYLQQLIMESLGKELDLDGVKVCQGIAVYGNKGSTDQHAYVQQLRDGINNFFATFIEVRRAQLGKPLEVEPGVTSGDYLEGFLRGTRAALAENGRESLTISVPDCSARSLGALIALYERAVGFYATLVNINAYHQPGVEAGKKAATRLLELQRRVREALSQRGGSAATADELAASLSADPEDVYHILVHLAANCDDIGHLPGSTPSADTFTHTGSAV